MGWLQILPPVVLAAGISDVFGLAFFLLILQDLLKDLILLLKLQ